LGRAAFKLARTVFRCGDADPFVIGYPLLVDLLVHKKFSGFSLLVQSRGVARQSMQLVGVSHQMATCATTIILSMRTLSTGYQRLHPRIIARSCPFHLLTATTGPRGQLTCVVPRKA
jgi:hypothetical protein